MPPCRCGFSQPPVITNCKAQIANQIPGIKNTPSINVLFLTLKTFSATGGIEKFNRCFAKALQENGQEEHVSVKVLSIYDRQPDEKYISRRQFRGFGGNKLAFAAHGLFAARTADIIIASHINLASLLQIIRRIRPGAKQVLVAHGIEVWRPLSGIQQKALEQVQQVWCVSRFTKNSLLQQKGLTENACRIFHNTIDPFFCLAPPAAAAAIRAKHGIKNDEKLLLTVSRLSMTEKQKGYDALLQAMPAILAQLPKAKYILAGKADAAELARLSETIATNKLHESVILAGYIADDDLPAYYAAADLFAMPSSKEGFGIVFIEAAFSGTDVLAGNRDGSADALLDGAIGTLIDPNDQAAIRNAVVSALGSPLSQQEKEKRRQLVQAHFGFERFKLRQLELLKALTVEAAS